MAKSKRKKFAKIALVANGLAFLIGGFSIISDGKLYLAGIQIITGFMNFIMISEKWNKQTQNHLTGLLFLLNILVAVSVSVDYFQSGSKYIQYAWILAAVFSFIAFLIHLRKLKSKKAVI